MGIDLVAYSRAKKAVNIAPTHSFESDAARDNYFVSNGEQLKDGTYALVNNSLMQYKNGSWTSSTIVVKGDNGVGITEIVDNKNNTFTIKLSDGTAHTITKTDSGSSGAVSVWISGSDYPANSLVVFNDNLYLILNDVVNSTSNPETDISNFTVISGSGVTLPNVTGIAAENHNSGTEIIVSWTNAVEPSFVENEVYVSTNDISNYSRNSCIASATLLYTGTASSYTHTNVLFNTRYYYKVFSKYDIVEIKYSSGAHTNILCQNTTHPSNVSNLSAICSDSSVTLTWSDSVESDWAGTVVRRKIGSYPQSETDGDLVVISTSKNQYVSTGYVDTGLTNDTVYYYKLFPYNSSGFYNVTSGSNEIFATPKMAIPYKIYTVQIDLTNSNPSTSVTYANDAVGMAAGSTAWDDFFGHYPVLFKNGLEVGKLNPNNFAQFEDGSAADITSGNAGDVMIAFPRRGLKITTVGNILTVSMTDDPDNASFEYLAHTRGSTRLDKFYLGAYKGYSLSSKLRSLSGKTPTATQTIGTFRTQAQANGTRYEQSGFYQLIFRQAMYLLKYKNLDSQTALGRGYVDGNTAPTSTGGTDSKGMNFGESTGKLQMKLFGIEDFWGNVFEFIDGVVSDSTIKILTATTGFNDAGSGYIDYGKGADANIVGHMSKPQGTTNTGFIAKEVIGSTTTYFCDYAGLSSSCIACFGGHWNNASDSGVFRLYFYYTSSTSVPYVSSRLMYL